jgi:hypothetical protein
MTQHEKLIKNFTKYGYRMFYCKVENPKIAKIGSPYCGVS